MDFGPIEVILVSFVSLLGMAIPLAALIGVIFIYKKLSNIERRLDLLEKQKEERL